MEPFKCYDRLKVHSCRGTKNGHSLRSASSRTVVCLARGPGDKMISKGPPPRPPAQIVGMEIGGRDE